MHRYLKTSLFLLVSLLVGCGSQTTSSSEIESLSSEQSLFSSEEISSEPCSSENSSSNNSSSDIEESLWDKEQDYLREGVKNIDFYNLNDLHGSVEPASNEPGIAKISTYLINSMGSNASGFVLTSSGDMWQGSADSNITKGKLIVDWMNYLAFDAQAIGNHEYDWKIDAINANEDFMNFPMLACNIIDEMTNEPITSYVSPYTTITRNGVHIGIIGSIGEGQTGSILASNVKGLTFANPTQYVKKWSNYLKDNGADVILYLTHNSVDTIDYELKDYIDAAFCGHTHQTETTYLNNQIPLLQGNCNGKYASHISLCYDFTDNEISYGECDVESIPTSLKDDKGTLDIKKKYEDEINAVKNEVVLESSKNIDRNAVPNIWNQYALKYYNEVSENKYEISAVETNNARSTIYASNGAITYGAIYKALPFDNILCVIRFKGSFISTLATYESSHWFVTEDMKVTDRYRISNYFTDPNKYYYILTIDYIAEYEGYDRGVEIVEKFYEEEALPRNIFANYLVDYPNNVVSN